MVEIITFTSDKERDMNKLTFLLIVLLLCKAGVSQNQNFGIGDSIDALHYSIHLDDVNTVEQTISGYAEIEIVPLIPNINYIALELLQLTVDSVFVNQSSVSYYHIDERLTINLDMPISLADTTLVKVYYQGQPFSEAWGGFHFSGDYAFNLGVGFESIPHNLGKAWFPCIDNFTDRAEYDLYATVTSGLTATGGGFLVDTVNNDNNTTTWHWKLPHGIPTYLASVAIGNYVEYQDEYFGIEDTIPISIFTKPSNAGNIEGSFVNLHAVLNFFESHFGAYPFEKVGYTGTATGAMEHASNIAYPHFAINGETSYESLYTHELSHMWFGNKVTCSTAEDMWLNEGWATFCELYYLDDLYTHAEFITEMREMHKAVLQRGHIIDGGYWALNNIPQEYTYGKTAYDKGGTVVNTLRNYLGDSVFFDAITAYLNTDSIAYHSVSSYVLRDFLTEYTGINMIPFFDAWVMTPGTPHFSIDSMLVTDNGAGFVIDVWLKQKYKGYDFLADNNVIEVTFVNKDFVFYTDTVHFSGRSGHSVKYVSYDNMSSEPLVAIIDMYEKVSDATIDNFKFFTEPGSFSFPSTYFQLFIDKLSDTSLASVTHSWIGADSLKIPVDGLRLSPTRYWKIEGVFDDSFQAYGKFFYNRTSSLEDSLIFSENDSIIILYRENTYDDWHEIPQRRIGSWFAGKVEVDTILPGEYTLAVWDKQVVDIPESDKKTEKIRIYPNPSNGKLNFKFSRKGDYSILLFNEGGKRLNQFQITSKRYSWDWKNENISPGVIFVYVSEEGKVLTSRKVILIR
jgi:aminopeptidase N